MKTIVVSAMWRKVSLAIFGILIVAPAGYTVHTQESPSREAILEREVGRISLRNATTTEALLNALTMASVPGGDH